MPGWAVPLRIQRKRTKGWRTPPNTVYVGRGSKWANPHRALLTVTWSAGGSFRRMNAEEVVERYRQDLPFLLASAHLDVSELRGKNLMCWCELGTPCHADVLLEVANK